MGALETREALSEWPEEPIDKLIVRVRTRRGKTQDALVEALRDASGNPSVDRIYISRWEQGRRIPTPYWRGYLSDVLDIPLDVLDRAVAIARAQRDGRNHSGIREEARLPASPGSASINASLQSPTGTGSVALTAMWVATPRSIGDAMNRAQFLSLMGATAAGAFAEEAFELLRFAETPGPSEKTVSVLEHAVAGLEETSASITLPASQLVGPVGQHLAVARRMLSESPGAQRERLCAIASQAARLLGALSCDMHDPHHGRLYLHTAERLAYEAGHPALASFAISEQAIHTLIHDDGDPQTGLHLIRHAREVAGRSAPAPLQAWLAAVEARALADLGDAHGCNKALDVATTAVGHGRPPGASVGGMLFFDARRLEWYEAMCRAHLGENEVARSMLMVAETNTDPRKMPLRTSIRLEIATTHAQDGDARHASEIAIQALDQLPYERRNSTVMSRAKRLDARLMEQQPKDPSAREFHERLLTA